MCRKLAVETQALIQSSNSAPGHFCCSWSCHKEKLYSISQKRIIQMSLSNGRHQLYSTHGLEKTVLPMMSMNIMCCTIWKLVKGPLAQVSDPSRQFMGPEIRKIVIGIQYLLLQTLAKSISHIFPNNAKIVFLGFFQCFIKPEVAF